MYPGRPKGQPRPSDFTKWCLMSIEPRKWEGPFAPPALCMNNLYVFTSSMLAIRLGSRGSDQQSEQRSRITRLIRASSSRSRHTRACYKSPCTALREIKPAPPSTTNPSCFERSSMLYAPLFKKNHYNTSAVCLTNLRSTLILASCLIHRPPIFAHVSSFKYV